MALSRQQITDAIASAPGVPAITRGAAMIAVNVMPEEKVAELSAVGEHVEMLVREGRFDELADLLGAAGVPAEFRGMILDSARKVAASLDRDRDR